MKLEFTTTAIIRPDVLDQTYSSLNNVLVDVDLKTEGVLYINIDPVPDGSDQAIQQEIEMARSHFKEVHYRIGEPGGNFSKAASWVLNQPKQEFFFNIEDDWSFTGNICVEDCIEKLQSDQRHNMLQCTIRNPGQNRIHFPPSLFQTSVIQSILKQCPIPTDENPERWLMEIKTDKKLVDYNVNWYSEAIARDNGRSWMRIHGMSKDKNIMINKHGKPQGNFTKYKFGE